MRNVKQADAGRVLSDTLRKYMYDMKIDDGLHAVGYTKDDIPALVKGTMPQVNIYANNLCQVSIMFDFTS